MEDITLYNAYYDKQTEKTLYSRTYLFGVDWQGSNAIAIRDKGLISEDKTEIFIPFSIETAKKYIKPKAFSRLSENEREKYFTFSNKDIVVKGIVDFDVTGEKGHTKKDLESNYDDVLTIISVSTFDYGSENMQHWEVLAK
ncbi:MAG: hypothetical protein NSGCLCUN01_03992 [uncultured Clostridium sp.]